MRCNCGRGNGPWLPTLDEVREAAHFLPNPNGRNSSGYRFVVRASAYRHALLTSESVCGRCGPELNTMVFELAAAPDAFGARRCEWRYMGGVRV